MFKFIKSKISKVYNQFAAKLSSVFSNNQLDEKFLKELKVLLLSADAGIDTTKKIIEQLSEKISNKSIQNMEQARQELEKILIETLNFEKSKIESKIIMLVGINGTGKTTFAAKLANKLKNEGQKVLLVAADTFRAAAVEQLVSWGQKIDVEVFTPKANSDPASVVFDAVKHFKEQNYDRIIIDTAGRLQTKKHLMRELEKIKNVIKKVVPEEKISSLLTVDAMLGQNSLQQARIFKDITKIDGIILTKLDGTGKGGIVFSITQELNLPIDYITFGEKLADIKEFDAKEFVADLLNG